MSHIHLYTTISSGKREFHELYLLDILGFFLYALYMVAVFF